MDHIFGTGGFRSWMGLDRETFYDESRIAIAPMGFRFRGRR